MATIFTKGDIFNTDGIRAYAFGTNCEGTLDSGIAIAFKKKWPKMAEALAIRCKGGGFQLGDTFEFRAAGETVFALALQETETKKAKLPALTKSVIKLVELATAGGLERVGLSRPGTGQAGLEWPRVKSILTEIGDETDLALVVFEQFIRRPDDAAPPKSDA